MPFGSGIVVVGDIQLAANRLIGKYVNPAQAGLGIIYISRGERWDAIAYKMYGDATLVSSLILSNPGILAADYVAQGAKVFVPLLVPVTTTSPSTPWG